jgi:hypothetical protein
MFEKEEEEVFGASAAVAICALKSGSITSLNSNTTEVG